jgi:hypothetical protein
VTTRIGLAVEDVEVGADEVAGAERPPMRTITPSIDKAVISPNAGRQALFCLFPKRQRFSEEETAKKVCAAQSAVTQGSLGR